MSRFEFLAKPKVKFRISEKATKICTIVLMVWTFTEFGPRFLCQTVFFYMLCQLHTFCARLSDNKKKMGKIKLLFMSYYYSVGQKLEYTYD